MDYKTLVTNTDWNEYFLNSLRNKGLKEDKEMWKTSSNKFRFIHFSPRIREILESGSINISGGGLMGVVYVTPIHADGSVHNLGQYIYDVEFPQSLNDKPVECLVFELSEEQYNESLVGGKFNYIFKSSHYVKGNIASSTTDLYKNVLSDIKQVLDVKDDYFLDKADTLFQKYTFMKHVYFEALNEYLYIKQDSLEAIKYLNKGEVYAKKIKDYLFEVTPKLKTSFSTTHFVTDSKIHSINLQQRNDIISNLDIDDFFHFLTQRVRFYLNELQTHPEAVLGRLLLKTETGPSKNIIEQGGADSLREELGDIALFQYETVPKGELGINASKNITVYKAKYTGGAVEQLESIELEINPLLTNDNLSILRVKS